MIWRNGVVPAGGPAFAATLTSDLLDHAYGMLSLALRARDLGVQRDTVAAALAIAAECIESAVRKGTADDPERGFHLVVCAASFHLAQFAARAFSLIPSETASLNLSTVERALIAMIRGSRTALRDLTITWLSDQAHTDQELAARLADAESVGLDDVEVIAITSAFVRALALFDSALSDGKEELLTSAREGLSVVAEVTRTRGFVSLWWASELARHLIDDIWHHSLHEVLPKHLEADEAENDLWERLRSHFVGMLAQRRTHEIELWPSQLGAASRTVDPSDDLVVALPTSAGKTRIAELCILRCLASGRRVVYVTPLRALSAQVERGLARTFVPLGFSVTALYGASGVAVADIGTLESSAIVVATPEKLDFAIRQQPSVLSDVGLVVLDEGHMIGFGEREIRYEALVQRLLRRSDADRRRLVCLSAIFSAGEAFDDFTKWLRSDAPGEAVRSDWRPTRQRSATITWQKPNARLQIAVDGESPFVPAFFSIETPIEGSRRRKYFPNDDQEFVLATAKAFLNDGQRVLVYCPERRSVEMVAGLYMKLVRQGHLTSVLPPDVDLSRALHLGEEWLGSHHVAVECLRLGVAVHHGALPRAFLSEIENLLSQRQLLLTIASPTLAQGVDLSASVLILRSINRAGKPIRPEEYANVVGRAGRAFVDLDGLTVYPVFETGFVRTRKLNAYAELQRAARQRSLESGILQLVQSLIELLAKYSGATFSEIAEYVTNTAGPWSPSLGRDPAATIENEEDPHETLSRLLENLDVVLLGSVDAQVAIEQVADALDESLRTSLWSRRLERLTPEDESLQRAVVLGRTTWLWRNTSPVQRSAFYSAGVGHETGILLDKQLGPLLDAVLAAERFLAISDGASAANAIKQLVEAVFAISSFAPRRMPESWYVLTTTWLSGDDLPPVLSEPDVEIDFIQDALVYRLVWAIEAIRVHGVAYGDKRADLVSGMLAQALTYGLPSLSACLLAQGGLSSRSLIRQLLRAFPAEFNDLEGVRHWVARNHVEIDQLITSSGERLLWRDFMRRWSDQAGGEWETAIVEIRVRWDGIVPAAGSAVRTVWDRAAGESLVYDDEMNRLGILDARSPDTDSGLTVATVTPDQTSIVVKSFGPRSA